MEIRSLLEEFPRESVHWRAQTLSMRNPQEPKALALAYIDARDVMDRLDAVCGPENWSDSYCETPSGRIICSISVLIGDEWVTKADGAGDTDVEGAKGAISDAFKRAAVKWGIGRYLYDVKAPWVPCRTYKGRDGKDRWDSWAVDPWTCVRNPPSTFDAAAAADRLIASITKAETIAALDEINRAELQTVEKIKATSPDDAKRLILAYRDRKAALTPKEQAA